MKTLFYYLTFLKYSAMEWLYLYSKYFIKLGISLKSLFSTPTTAITTSTVVIASTLTSTEKAIYLLIGFFLLDFLTGILASWKEKIAAEKINPELKKENLISSEKLRLSGIKAFTYASAILAVWGIEKVFIIKSFKIDHISEEHMTITLMFIGFCCAIEFYSIFFENLKRSGYDIKKNLVKIIVEVKKIINKVTT